MRKREIVALAFAAAILLFALAVNGRISTVEHKQIQFQKTMLQPIHYTVDLKDGGFLHLVKIESETLEEFGARVQEAVKNGFVPEAGPAVKSKTWTDVNGNVHTVSLTHDPAWSRDEFCERFDEAVAFFEDLFPCIPATPPTGQ